MLKKLKVLVVVLAVTLAAASPALAQEAQDPETVTVTFRLSVDGQVPGWQHFGVDYPVGGEDVVDIPLCTTGTDSGQAAPPCRDGETYTASIEVLTGTPLAFDFVRNDTRTTPERFKSEAGTFTEDATVSAAYHFPGGVASGAVEDQYAAASDGDETSTPPQGDSGGAATVAGGGQTGGGETVNGSVGSGSAGVEASGGIAGGVLPDTGGATLLLAGAGALLTVGGLLAYHRAR